MTQYTHVSRQKKRKLRNTVLVIGSQVCEITFTNSEREEKNKTKTSKRQHSLAGSGDTISTFSGFLKQNLKKVMSKSLSFVLYSEL